MLIYYFAGKQIHFCGICTFFCLLFSAAILHCVIPLQGQLNPITNTHQTKLTFNKRWKSGLGLSPRFKPFWREVRGESLKKDEMNIVSLTLRDCLGLSFQGMYIYLFICLFIIIIIIIIIFIQFGLTLIAGVEIQEGVPATLAHI